MSPVSFLGLSGVVVFSFSMNFQKANSMAGAHWPGFPGSRVRSSAGSVCLFP